MNHAVRLTHSRALVMSGSSLFIKSRIAQLTLKSCYKTYRGYLSSVLILSHTCHYCNLNFELRKLVEYKQKTPHVHCHTPSLSKQRR